MRRHKGNTMFNTMFNVGGAVRCDCQCLEGCAREIGSDAVCSWVMEGKLDFTLQGKLDFTL